MANLREVSRSSWGPRGHAPSAEEINTGSLQRVADALEKIADDRVKLENQVYFLKKRVSFIRREKERLERSNAALRGVITKMKRKK